MNGLLLEEYRVLREGAAVLGPGARARIAAVGADRLSYLHAMLTNDVATLAPGTGCYAAYLTPQGRMIADVRVLELGDLTLLDLDASVASAVVERFEQFVFSEDVHFSDLTLSLAAPGVFGPAAPAVVAAIVGPESGLTADGLAGLAEHHSVRAKFRGSSVVVAANRDLGVPGFDLYVDRGAAPALVAAAIDAGAREVSEAAAEVVRVEAGRPRFGVDMDEHTIPLEAGLELRAISYTKGCYPGQEVIVRVRDRGHGKVAKQLVGLAVDGATTPSPADPIVAGDKEVGRVTSAVFSPSLDRPIALGYVSRDHVAAGTGVVIVHAGGALAAEVANLPFVADDRCV
jgi:folate-binding protein YgfZ